MTYTYGRILFNHKKTEHTDDFYMNDPQKHYTKGKQQDTKIVYYVIPFIWDIQGRKVHGSGKQIGGFQVLGELE
jgi:hypothetical protein